ncbi:hypothetical protein HPP92_011144 [Vanilla planifolia]|uniref:Amino acid transporter transmembrane domain-containing protein n=1 Tax=Vanilla planifolia TaxID=51239 RepID=A0A835R7V4_VANPL|nr:hypothetical protein HPP92_011144 [Vanilla planifolia]
MKRATLVSVAVTTIFYMLCGCMGYAAFGDAAPGNLLTGFGFYNPFWLLDIANAAIVIHLVGAYQVYCQPLFAFIEKWASRTWPDSSSSQGDQNSTLLQQVLQPQPLPARLALRLRRADHRHLHAASLLQRRRGPPRRARVLASHGLFSGGDVHSSEEGAQVEYEVGLPSDAELCLPRDLRRRGRRVHRRSGRRSQSVPAVQIGIMRILCLHLFSVTVTVLHYSFAS